MQKAIATTIMVLVLACSTVLLLSACTLPRNNGGSSSTITDQHVATFLGKIRAHPEDAEARYSMGCIFQERKKHHLAIEEFKMAVESDPSNVAAYNGMGVSQDALGDHERAVAAYTAALEVDQNLDYVLNNLGYSYLLQGRLDLAIESFKKAVELDGKNQRYRNNLGLAYARSGNYDAAFAEFTGDDEARAHLNIARLYYRNGLCAEARVHYAQARLLKPSEAETDRGLAAAISLAEIHSNSLKAPENAGKTLTYKPETVMHRYDDDGFYTIPAGAIEDFEIVEAVQAKLTETESDASKPKDEAPFYSATPARIANLEEEREATRKILKSKRLKIHDEAQALELLSLRDADTDKGPNPRIKIEVSNGNGVTRMARRVGNYLKGKGFILMYLSNASHFNYEETSIYYTSGYLREAYRLSQELPGLQYMEEVSGIRDGNAEINILIGRDLRPYLSLFQEG